VKAVVPQRYFLKGSNLEFHTYTQFMEAVGYSETLVTIYHTTRPNGYLLCPRYVNNWVTESGKDRSEKYCHLVASGD
jgi:hypothetical protein